MRAPLFCGVIDDSEAECDSSIESWWPEPITDESERSNAETQHRKRRRDFGGIVTDGTGRLMRMTAIDYIKAEQATTPVDKKGKPIAIHYAPGLSPEAIDSVEQRVGLPLPEELRTLLAFCAGIRETEIDFTGEAMHFEYKEVFPNGLPIARDGCGNFWVLDITPVTAKTAPIFFVCHDAPVVLYQSPDIASFLREMLGKGGSLIRDIPEDPLSLKIA